MFYDEMAQTASELIAEFGQPCTLSVFSQASYDVESGTVNQKTTNYSAHCYLNRRYFDFPKNKTTHANSNLVEQGDVLIYLSAIDALSQNNLLGAMLHVGTEKWRIIHAQPLKPAAKTVYFQLQARKA